MPIENSPNTDGSLRTQPPEINVPPSSGGIVKPMRPQPPSLRDPRRGESRATQEWEMGVDVNDESEMDLRDADGADDEGAEGEEGEYPRDDMPDWEKRAKDAYRFSTTYLDSNYRSQWDDSLKAFNNQHPSDSRYNSENFRKRSRLFVPITRTVIRKHEAAACKAFFSNQELASIKALNDADPKQRLSAALMEELIDYRLTHTIPWFKILIGGIQDAQNQGGCVAHIHWKYAVRPGMRGSMIAAKDEPCIDLKPLENFRFDPSANWLDPVNTSPYWIEMVPMYMHDVLERMDNPDPKGRQWKRYGPQDIRTENPDDSTRMARLGNQQDPSQETRDVSDYEVVWVQRHIHRFDGNDWEFWTLNNGKLLTDADLLERSVFHGLRPYVMGHAILEAHKVLPTSVPTLVKPLQDAINTTKNSRNDNVLLCLNKRYKVKRGTNVDTAALMRNVAGGITMVDNMEDVEEQNWPDVTASAYQEEDRTRQAFDDLIGNFNPMQLHQAGAPREAQGTIRMLQGPASEMTEYMLQTFAITFVQPVLRQLVLLEQKYETDETILAIAGNKAQALQKFGVDKVTDKMLEHQLTTTVNVGMGSTDPVAKLQRFVYAVQAFAQVAAKPPPGVNLSEVWKEICALSGYQDGERFSTQGNPEMAKLEQVNKQLMMKVQDLMRHKADKEGSNVVKLITAREANATREKIAAMTKGKEHQMLYAQHLLDQDDALLAHVLGKSERDDMAQQQQAQGGAPGQPGAAPPQGAPPPQQPNAA